MLPVKQQHYAPTFEARDVYYLNNIQIFDLKINFIELGDEMVQTTGARQKKFLNRF